MSKLFKILFELWKWKLIVTSVFVIFITLPVILKWDRVDFITLLIIYTVMSILTWLSLTFGLYMHGKQIRKELNQNKDE